MEMEGNVMGARVLFSPNSKYITNSSPYVVIRLKSIDHCLEVVLISINLKHLQFTNQLISFQ